MNKLHLLWIIPLILALTLSLARGVSPKEIDDITPAISCGQKYIDKADILWVIPYFNNKPISENKEWCEKILSLNKTLGLHGIHHSPYQEFKQNITEEELINALNEFETCFGAKPKLFKAPQLALSSENKKLLEKYNLKIRGRTNQVLHKVYHCGDSGVFSNSFLDFF